MLNQKKLRMNRRGNPLFYEGKGISKSVAPFAVRLPKKQAEQLKVLPNLSTKLRQWILEGMEREGMDVSE